MKELKRRYMKKRSDTITVFSQVHLNDQLIDQRLRKGFAIFGTVGSVAKQYGIETKRLKNGMKFTAPKSRMQMFVEKLHFSGVEYQELI